MFELVTSILTCILFISALVRLMYQKQLQKLKSCCKQCRRNPKRTLRHYIPKWPTQNIRFNEYTSVAYIVRIEGVRV